MKAKKVQLGHIIGIKADNVDIQTYDKLVFRLTMMLAVPSGDTHPMMKSAPIKLPLNVKASKNHPVVTTWTWKYNDVLTCNDYMDTFSAIRYIMSLIKFVQANFAPLITLPISTLCKCFLLQSHKCLIKTNELAYCWMGKPSVLLLRVYMIMPFQYTGCAAATLTVLNILFVSKDKQYY